MIDALLSLCIDATQPETIGNTTVVNWQRFEPCPVAEKITFAPPIKYPTAKECKINPKLERCG